jgi:UDP-GlcNAc:undecaprenyl-phosphate GlcNAc-1-phosphate transferase
MQPPKVDVRIQGWKIMVPPWERLLLPKSLPIPSEMSLTYERFTVQPVDGRLAALATLALTPLMRRVALMHGIVDNPGARKVHQRPMPYLGGVAIAVSVVAGVIVGPSGTWRLGIVTAAALAVALVGLLDDRAPVGPLPRLASQTLAASAAAGAGVSARITGLGLIDFVLTVLVIVAVTNAFNLIDNMDGLSAGVAFMSSTGIAVAADLNGQVVLVSLAAAVAAASWGFLAWNLTPSSIFMGDAGALFLGFCVAVAAIELDPIDSSRAEALVVPALLLAVPAADLLTVVLSRTRRGVPITTAGKDHLSHRLRRHRRVHTRAVIYLVALQAVVAGVAVLVASNRVSASAGTLGGLCVVAAALLPAWRAHPSPNGPSANPSLSAQQAIGHAERPPAPPQPRMSRPLLKLGDGPE